MCANTNLIAPLRLFPSLSWFTTFSGPCQSTPISIQVSKPFRGNRLLLLGPNKLRTLSIPVHKPRYPSEVCDLRSVSESKWNRELMHALQTTYGKSAYFDHYEPILADFFSSPDLNLWDLATELSSWYNRVLQWESHWVLSPEPASDINEAGFQNPPYFQVFSQELGFITNASILDLIFNLGPEAGLYLERLKNL